MVDKPRWKSLARVSALAAVLLAVGIVFWPKLSPMVSAFAGEWDKTDFDIRSVELSEIMSGGPPKDGIPAIDEPSFVSLAEAADWLHPREPVIALRIGDVARAYPIQILIYHEIVNDELDGTPVSVTFCPLCNASIVFLRQHGDRLLDFGTTGRLRLSDLVMYDRQTESWWQQFVGEGIVGVMTGEVLQQLPSQIIAFEDFASAYPDGDVLSRETGYYRNYGRNPYAGYDSIDQSPFLYNGKIDPRLPPMERVLSVIGEDGTLLFPFSALDKTPLIQYELGDRPLVVFAHHKTRSALDKSSIAESRNIPAAAAFDRRLENSELSFDFIDGKVIDRQTKSEWGPTGLATSGPMQGKHLRQIDSGVHFAFAWLAFDSAAEVYKP
jgi:hypothetical protein